MKSSQHNFASDREREQRKMIVEKEIKRETTWEENNEFKFTRSLTFHFEEKQSDMRNNDRVKLEVNCFLEKAKPEEWNNIPVPVKEALR